MPSVKPDYTVKKKNARLNKTPLAKIVKKIAQKFLEHGVLEHTFVSMYYRISVLCFYRGVALIDPRSSRNHPAVI